MGVKGAKDPICKLKLAPYNRFLYKEKYYRLMPNPEKKSRIMKRKRFLGENIRMQELMSLSLIKTGSQEMLWP